MSFSYNCDIYSTPNAFSARYSELFVTELDCATFSTDYVAEKFNKKLAKDLEDLPSFLDGIGLAPSRVVNALKSFKNGPVIWEINWSRQVYIRFTVDDALRDCVLVDITGSSSVAEKVHKKLKELYLYEAKSSITWVLEDAAYPETLDFTLPTLKSPYTPEYYPYLDIPDMDRYAKSFFESSSNLLLLYGEPGTGKTSFIRHLLQSQKKSAIVAYNSDVLEGDNLFSYFLRSDIETLVIEDADEMLSKRESGNSCMKRLLNISDGLTSRFDKKIIISTNILNLSSLDSALTRSGRCFDRLKFNKLTYDQAMALIPDSSTKTLELPLEQDNKYSLAAVMHAIEGNENVPESGTSDNSSGFKIGFHNG